MSTKKHIFPWIGENQGPWAALGWAIIVASLVSVVLIKVFFPFQVPDRFNIHDSYGGLRPIQSPIAFATIAFFLTMVLASMIWTSLDLIDRRGRPHWMIPMMLCCFFCAPFVSQSLYMWIGRREEM